MYMCLLLSVAINTLGALTTSLNPPSVEAVVISRQAGYSFSDTYSRNFDFLNIKGSKSLIFQIFGIKYQSAWDYYMDITLFIILVLSILVICNRFEAEREKIK